MAPFPVPPGPECSPGVTAPKNPSNRCDSVRLGATPRPAHARRPKFSLRFRFFAFRFCFDHSSFCILHSSFPPDFTPIWKKVSLPSNENAIFISKCADFHDLRPRPSNFSISVFSVCFWKFLLSAFPISAFAQCPSNENGIFLPAGPLFFKKPPKVSLVTESCPPQ